MGFSVGEQVKWSLLDHAAARQPLGSAYGLVAFELPKGLEDPEGLIRSALLELVEEGLIIVYRASWDDAFVIEVAESERLSRAEVEAELAADVEASGRVGLRTFFDITERGDQRRRLLPPDAFLDPRQSFQHER